jgi:hypothetical protein
MRCFKWRIGIEILFRVGIREAVLEDLLRNTSAERG